MAQSINVDVIDTLIYLLYDLLKKYSDKHYIGWQYGYYEIKTLERKFSAAHDFLDNLKNLRFRVEMESECLCDKDAEKLIETVRTLTGSCTPLRLDLISDSSGYAEWVLNNPDSVPREVWEECLYTKCDNITYTLARELNESLVKCDVVYTFISAIKKCVSSYKIENKSDNCLIEYMMLKTQTSCTLTYDDYVEIHNCGGTYDLVKTALECGATVGVNLKSQCLEVTYNLKNYPINCYE